MRFEIESKCTREAHEETFAEYTAWLRDNEQMTVETFQAPTREQVKAAAVTRINELRREEGYAFICRPHQIAF